MQQVIVWVLQKPKVDSSLDDTLGKFKRAVETVTNIDEVSAHTKPI